MLVVNNLAKCSVVGHPDGRLRQECLNESWFLSLEDAREKVEAWRKHYNRERPHGALGNLTPMEFAMAGETVN